MTDARLVPVLLALALVMPFATALTSPGASADTPLEPLPVTERFTAAAELCGGLAACQAEALAVESAGLAEELRGLPSGPAGPAAWLEAAAGLAGAGAGPVEAPAPQGDLEGAFLALYEAAGVPVDPELREAVRTQSREVPADEAPALEALLLAIVEADALVDAGLAHVDAELLARDPARTLHLVTGVGSGAAAASPDDEVAYGQILQELSRVDRARLAGAAILLAVTLESNVPVLDDAEVDLPYVRVGADGDTTHGGDHILLVDRSGNDTYDGHVGSSLLGLFGAGVAVDRGDGADTYSRFDRAQGLGFLGVGLLVDEGGPDTYELTQFGQGAGFAGVGLLYDAGDAPDTYVSIGDDAILTKGAALAGLGVLVDEGGDDAMRQDALDGFAYGAGGGLGLLANRGDGDDTYRSDDAHITLLGEDLGNFTGPVQVSAEVHAAAILLDEGGRDRYVCGDHVRQGCQGAGGAGSLGALLDLGTDIDHYIMGVSHSQELVPGLPTVIFPMGQGAGYGPSAPGGVGVLHDEGGEDYYEAEKWAQGYGTVGLGLLHDGGGPDLYITAEPLVGARVDGSTWVDGDAGFGVDEAG